MQAARLAGMSKDQVKYWQKMFRLNPEHDDKNLDRATNFFLISGIPTIMLKYMYHTFAPYTIFRSVQSITRRYLSDDVNMRAARGLESMVVSKMITLSMLLAYIFNIGMMSADDEDDTIRDALRELPFSMEIVALLLLITDFAESWHMAIRPYLPVPLKQIVADESVREFVEDIVD